MRTHLRKWGNSLALRLPKSFAAQAHLSQDSPVEVSVAGGRLVITLVEEAVADLDELLADATADNLHREVDTGRAVGNEAW